MPTQGLTTFLGGGIRLKNAAASNNYVGLKITANPATSFDVSWLTALPASTQALTITSAGVVSTYS